MLVQIVCSILLFVFYLIYFSKMIIQKQKGIKTDQMAINKHVDKKLFIQELMMKIITYSVVVYEIFSIYDNKSILPSIFQYIGILIAFFGVIIFFFAVYHMRDSWRAGITFDKTSLITTSIYKYSRNPAFLGFDFLYIGVLLCFFNYILLGLSLLAIISLHKQIIHEEKHLSQVFGNDYVEYRNTVRRYCGRKWST